LCQYPVFRDVGVRPISCLSSGTPTHRRQSVAAKKSKSKPMHGKKHERTESKSERMKEYGKGGKKKRG